MTKYKHFNPEKYKMKRKFYTKEEIRYIKDNHNTMTYKEIALFLNKTLISTETKCRRLGFYCKSKQREQTKINHNFFKKWNANMAYVFGYWFADGHINKVRNNTYAFVITSKDKEHLCLIRDLMESKHKIHTTYNKNWDTYTYRLIIGSKTIWQDIQKLGGTPAKSLTTKFPQVPKECIKDFIRGYFDGDGSISLNRYNYPHITILGTKDFLSKFQKYLPYQTTLHQKYKKNISRSNKTYELRFGGKKAKNILNFMYGISSIFLDRKYDRYKQSLKWNGRERNTKLQKIYSNNIMEAIASPPTTKVMGIQSEGVL